MLTRSAVTRNGPLAVHTTVISTTGTTKANETKQETPTQRTLTLSDLVNLIENEIEMNDGIPLNKKEDIKQALIQYDGNLETLKRYALFDTSRNYTRNLIATDNSTYALMLLCWNRGKYSPIHDHPSDGCWVRHIHGTLNEVRYRNDGEKLIETSNVLINEGVSYMDDSLGLHKIGNPMTDVDAITLHLYAPPYEKCRLWFDPNDSTKSSTVVTNFYSEYGELAS